MIRDLARTREACDPRHILRDGLHGGLHRRRRRCGQPPAPRVRLAHQGLLRELRKALLQLLAAENAPKSAKNGRRSPLSCHLKWLLGHTRSPAAFRSSETFLHTGSSQPAHHADRAKSSFEAEEHPKKCGQTAVS